MRGAVTLAAALAIPLETDAGAPFPDRELIIFLAYCVVLFTVVVQGLTLPALIRALDVRDDGEDERREEIDARLAAADAALARLDALEDAKWTRPDTLERARGLYGYRRRRFTVAIGEYEDHEGIEDRSQAYQRLVHELIEAQREAILRLRNERRISSDVMRTIERELDLEESRLEI
jgi:CPA1 family monovalent cation:H+ antiporter